jgi:hypothetical protein
MNNMKLFFSILLIMSTLSFYGQNPDYIGYSKTYRKTLLRDKPDLSGSVVIGKIPGDKEVKVLEYVGKVAESHYFKIEYGGKVGYVDDETIEITYKMIQVRDAEKNKKEEIERRAYLESKYEKSIAERILKKNVWIGMTKEMAVDSWGAPSDINKSTGTWGIHEQWVYIPKDLASDILRNSGMDVGSVQISVSFLSDTILRSV